jgi:hypothetical protein
MAAHTTPSGKRKIGLPQAIERAGAAQALEEQITHMEGIILANWKRDGARCIDTKAHTGDMGHLKSLETTLHAVREGATP